MTSLGYMLVAIGAVLIREVIVGRVDHIGSDFRDFFVGLMTGDTAKLGEVASRRGENVPVEFHTGSTGTPSDFAPYTQYQYANKFLEKVVQLGDAADGYVKGAEGPRYYDCSGLVWKALYDLKIYTGARFTTSTFSRTVGPKIAVENPTGEIRPGDILIWDGHHMGVAMGDGDYYSAKNPDAGIGKSPISYDIAHFGRPPRVWRLAK